MLAPSWTFNTNAQYAQYLPPRPSPLSPRSANVYPPRFAWGRETMSKQNHVDQVQKSSTSCLQQSTPVPQPQLSSDANRTRTNAPPAFSLRGGAKPNPLMRKNGDQRERRRDLFMKKVQTGREDKRWEGRSEQILRSDYILEQRRWENERARSAPDLTRNIDVYEDEEEELPTSSFNMFTNATPSTPRLSPHQIEDEVDAVAHMEEQELEELLALAGDAVDPVTNKYMEEIDIPSSPTRYGSDEEDYDDIFMEMASSQDAYQQQWGSIQTQMGQHHMQEDVEMDMS